jgi:hypothetical protein
VVNLSGARQRRQADHEGDIALAWYVAGLMRRKKLPSLKELLSRRPPSREKRQAWQDQLAIARRWDAVVTKH